MAISRWDPFRDLASIQNELNRLFGRTFGEEESAGAEWVPAVDVYEDQDRIVLTMELPGASADDVDISVENAVLTVRGERRFYRDLRQEDFHRVERRFGSFVRSVTLPSTANAEAIQASFDAGVLTVEVPKKGEAKPRKIQMKARA
jgi:HSP20 family protein